jgi:hypothetical protein
MQPLGKKSIKEEVLQERIKFLKVLIRSSEGVPGKNLNAGHCQKVPEISSHSKMWAAKASPDRL